MNVYAYDIQTAVFAFPFVALIITVPFAIKQYRKYGSVPWLITLLTYSFIFYLMCAYFLVLLPLPEDHSIIVPGADHIRWVPFNSFGDLIPIIQSDLGFAEKLLAMVKSPCIYQYLFNILLLLPLGAYLRYFFNCRIRTCVLIGFAVSFSFEFLQFTGLLGIYEHPYRFADVDDLIANTLGAWLGAVLCQKVMAVLPKMEEVERKAWETGTRATTTQRALSLMLDLFFMTVLITGATSVAAGIAGVSLADDNQPAWLGIFQQVTEYVIIALLFGAVPAITRGQTLGQRILKLYTANLDGSRAAWWRVLLRYALLYLFLWTPLFIGVGIYRLAATATEQTGGVPWFLATHVELVFWVCVVLLTAYLVLLMVRAFLAWRKGTPFVLLYGVISRTRVLQAPVKQNGLMASPFRIGSLKVPGQSATPAKTAPAAFAAARAQAQAQAEEQPAPENAAE